MRRLLFTTLVVASLGGLLGCGPDGPTDPDPGPLPTDTDGDTIPDATDNCVNTPNADQADGDSDTLGDLCDPYGRAVVMVDIEGSGQVAGYEFELSYPNTVTLRCDVPGDSKTCLEPTGLFTLSPVVRASESPQRLYAKVTIGSAFDPFVLARTGAIVTFDINPGAPAPLPSEFEIWNGHALNLGGSVIPGLRLEPRVVYGI